METIEVQSSSDRDLRMHRMALQNVPLALVLTNPHIEDNPIVYVNRSFSRITGYAEEVAIGRNCRFLQGPDTDPGAIQALRDGVATGSEVSVDILNYKSDGTPFWNRVLVSPLHDETGRIQYFMGLHRALGERNETGPLMSDDDMLREIQHRVKNHLAMVVAIIRMQSMSRGGDPKADYASLARRVEALQLLYQEMTHGGSSAARSDNISLGAYLSRIAAAIGYLDGRDGIRLNLDLEDVPVDVEAAAQMGLVVSEILTNSYQHAFEGRPSGLVDMHLQRLSTGTVRLRIADDGVGLPRDVRWPESGSLGGRIVRSLLTGLDARIAIDRELAGTAVTIDVPLASLARGAEAAASEPHLVTVHPQPSPRSHGLVHAR